VPATGSWTGLCRRPTRRDWPHLAEPLPNRRIRRRRELRLRAALLGRSRDGQTSKVRLAAGRRCRPLAFVLTAAHAADSPQFIPVLDKGRRPGARQPSPRPPAQARHQDRHREKRARPPTGAAGGPAHRALTHRPGGHSRRPRARCLPAHRFGHSRSHGAAADRPARPPDGAPPERVLCAVVLRRVSRPDR
jgi:hypothetical protein